MNDFSEVGKADSVTTLPHSPLLLEITILRGCFAALHCMEEMIFLLQHIIFFESSFA